MAYSDDTLNVWLFTYGVLCDVKNMLESTREQTETQRKKMKQEYTHEELND